MVTVKKIGFMVLTLLLLVGAAQAATLTVTVNNSDSDQGYISVGLYNFDTMQNFAEDSSYYQGKQSKIATVRPRWFSRIFRMERKQ